jgi:thiamine biosynthesis lipoprotein
MADKKSVAEELREQLFHTPKSAAERMSEEEIAAARLHCSMDSLVLDEENLTAYISDPAASLDVGAFGKGYAAERVAELLSARGVSDSYVLDFGGNLRVIGAPHNRDAFIAGIRDPQANASGEHVLRLYLKNASLVTSGSYFRYFEIDGVRYHHLIDPETGYPASVFSSVTIYGADSGICDALSTALFVMTEAEGRALLEERFEGYEAVWVYASGEMHMSEGIEEFVVK